jgi:hypothetical protein
MAATPGSGPAPLPALTLSQLTAWDTEHLERAATAWTATADRWCDGFTAINSEIVRPGGTEWAGASADAAAARTDRDRVHVGGLAERLRAAAAVAKTGAADLAAAKWRALAFIDTARQSGFVVSEDLSVRDGLTAPSKQLRLVRDLQAQVFTADIRAQSTTLAATDQSVASKLNTFAAGFGNVDFPETPSTEPPPPKLPMPPYQPEVWGACAARGGGNPNKVVRTFHRAPLVAGVSAMPGGDTVLYCGNDKYGFYHLLDRHGQDWQNVAMSRFPGGGNWRYLADYSIGATLANPERVDYNSGNDTFTVQRNIYRITDDGLVYSFTCRVVVSATDGKIITAFPTTKQI